MRFRQNTFSLRQETLIRCRSGPCSGFGVGIGTISRAWVELRRMILRPILASHPSIRNYLRSSKERQTCMEVIILILGLICFYWRGNTDVRGAVNQQTVCDFVSRSCLETLSEEALCFSQTGTLSGVCVFI